MKTVTEKFISAQKAPDAVFVRQVYYKRRYWNPTTRVYVWESAWTQLTEDKIQSVSPIQWQLDTDQLNEFKVSNVTILVDNSNNLWRHDSRDGFFKQDTASPVYGYEPYWNKFQIKSGFVLADGTTETVAIFTGLATEYTMDSQSKICQISIDGLEALLVNAKAEAICTTVSLENMGTGDGANKDFTTLNPGVSAFSLVSKAGITQVEGQHYTVSQLNDATLGAKISFVNAPDIGNAINGTYIYWPQSKKFEELVALLLTAGGISAGSQSISPVNFSNSVLNTQTYTTQADWATGTLATIEDTSTPGALLINWEDDSILTVDSGWATPNVGTGWTTLGGGAKTKYRTHTKGVGIWSFSYDWKTTATSAVAFACTALNSGYDTMDGYKIVVTNNAGVALITLKYNSTTLGSFAGGAPNAAEWYFRIVRTAGGSIRVSADMNYFGGAPTLVSKLTVVDPAPGVVSSYFAFSYKDSPGADQSILGAAGTFGIPFTSATASWSSATIDMTGTPTSWGQFDVDKTDSGFTVAVESRTSANGIAWDAWIARTVSNVPGSTLRRYAQVRITVTFTSSGGYTADFIARSLDFRWTTASTLVTLPNFTGDSIYDALAKIGEFTNYEFGFNPDETFFFRPKTTSDPVMTLTQSDYLSQITGMESGYSRVYGIVRATYGEIVKEITDDGAFAASPLARVTNKRFEISPDSNIQIPTTADIATGVASSFYSYLSKKRRRLKARAKFIPQIDLSDAIIVDLINNPPDHQWFLGDPSTYLGKPDTHLWGNDQQITRGFLGKVIAARYDTSGRNCEFELEEIV